MSAAPKHQLVSVDDYLAAERVASVRHEYLGGVVHAMAGARNAHNLIIANVIGSLHYRLRGHKCRVYSSDTRIRIRLPAHVRFYYADVPIICRPNPQSDEFQDEPAVLVEVLTRSTRRIDEGEKKDAYLTISSLNAYLLIEPEFPAVVVYRRSEQGFVREVYQGFDAIVPLAEVGIELPLAEVFDGVESVPEPEEG